MFEVHGTAICVSRGDTGLLTFTADGVSLTENDRAVFTVKGRGGGVVIRKIIKPQENSVTVPFVSADTEALRPGAYEWDIRYVLEAEMDGRGDVTDGREIITPFPPGKLTVVRTVGSV